MDLKFEKYQGTGNDFVMIDNRTGKWDALSLERIRQLCDRRFGIGADGLIKIGSKEGFDFEVDYYNSDGSKSFCGNGARCSVAFAHSLGITADKVSFWAIDGAHEAEKKNGLVHLRMQNVADIVAVETDFTLNTGSPHYIRFTEKVDEEDMVGIGKSIRYSADFQREGINVNLVQLIDSGLFRIRTYERGVEDETLSCGTGVTAAALAVSVANNQYGALHYAVQSEGGSLAVSFERTEQNRFRNIWLIGPATHVFSGNTDV